jgi:HPt (histidine-containing phosphotransfer) domain-containing protein
MSSDDQEKLECFETSATLAEAFGKLHNVAEAEVESREMLLGDVERSSLAAANSDRRQVLTLLGGQAPMVSSGGEDANYPGQNAARALAQSAEGKNAATVEARGTILSTMRDIPRMKQIIAEYVQGLPGEVAKLLESVNLRDLQPLRRVAHQLRGSGGGYGFEAISELAGKVEDAILSGDNLGAVRTRVLALVDAICRVEGYDDSNR